MSMSVTERQAVERKIVTKLLEDAIAAGYLVTVDNGEDFPTRSSKDVAAILAGMFQTDEEWLHLDKDDEQGRGRRATIYLVYGNGGYDVIADYNSSLEPVLMGATALANQLEDDEFRNRDACRRCGLHAAECTCEDTPSLDDVQTDEAKRTSNSL